jgi:hypothetical protein
MSERRIFGVQLRSRARSARSGQAMVEFALVFGALFLVIGAVIQFGLLLWSQNSLTQIDRDTARWEVTQSTVPCEAGLAGLASRADSIAKQWGLPGYGSGMWPAPITPGIDTVGSEGISAVWIGPPGLQPSDCPPDDATIEWYVTVRINHVVPIFFPGLQFVAPPCSSSGFCISSTTRLRMEPKAP